MKKIALLGAGFIAGVHMEGWKRVEGAEVCAFFETNLEKASAFQDKYQIPHYNSFSRLLEEEKVDIVDICLPTFLHREYTEMAASHEKHVFCEKPIALTVEDAEAMKRICERSGVGLMVGQVLRFWGEYVKARELVEEGAVGKVLSVDAFRLSLPPTWSVDSWILKPELSGGAAVDLHIHDLDYVNWLLGEPQVVFAQGVRSPQNSWDHMVTVVNYGGVIAHIEGGWMMRGDFPFTCGFRILGDEGVLEWSSRAGVNIEEREKTSPLVLYRNGEAKKEMEVREEDPYYLELEYFLDCIENNKPVERGTPEQAILALRLALAARQSAEEREKVKLGE